MAKVNNPRCFAALEAAIASAQQQITAIIPRIEKLEQVYESTSKVAASVVVTVPTTTAASRKTVTLAAECDYVVCEDHTIANGGSASFEITDISGSALIRRTITCSLANKKTLSVEWSAISISLPASRNFNFVGYKYLV